MLDTSVQLAYDRSLRRYDKEGRLHVELTPISKANICPYFGREIPGGFALGLEPDRIYQMLRAPDELAKGAQSSNNIQLLETHIGVTARDPKKQETVGSTGTDAVFDAPYLKNSLVIWDKAAIDLIESDRKKELSCSYSYVADMTPGTYLGLKYDGIMRDIAFNHVALVKDGRAGADVLVEDSLPLLLKRSLVRMPNNVKLATSRKALVARGALVAFISPKLANDAQIDYSKILKGITAENWVENRPVLLSRIKIATNGKLANDEDLEGMDGVLKMLDKTGEDEKDEEEETSAHVIAARVTSVLVITRLKMNAKSVKLKIAVHVTKRKRKRSARRKPKTSALVTKSARRKRPKTRRRWTPLSKMRRSSGSVSNANCSKRAISSHRLSARCMRKTVQRLIMSCCSRSTMSTPLAFLRLATGRSLPP